MRPKGAKESSSRLLLTDANVLLLLSIGSFDPRLILTFKRLSDFSIQDFYLLRDFSSSYTIAATPHVFTEVSNLANALPERTKARFFAHFASTISGIVERAEPTASVVLDHAFILFGLTDAALCRAASSGLVLTQDGRLRSYLRQRGARAMGLEDLRELRINTTGKPRRLR